MGLQLTHTNWKGKFVHMITSEGGVGRGEEPLTTLANLFFEHQGGSPITTYAPAYTMSTSGRRGIVFPHTNIGLVDLRNSENIATLLWHSSHIEYKVVTGRTLKNVTTGISSIVGRMKVLPEWTQKGAIIGLQGGQTEVMKQYEFLKTNGVPITSVWMQDWVGTAQFTEAVRLLWNW